MTDQTRPSDDRPLWLLTSETGGGGAQITEILRASYDEMVAIIGHLEADGQSPTYYRQVELDSYQWFSMHNSFEHNDQVNLDEEIEKGQAVRLK